MNVDKSQYNEQEIRTMFISPALNAKGWVVPTNMREEYYFTDGRVHVAGSHHSVAADKKADYLLYHQGKPLAVVLTLCYSLSHLLQSNIVLFLR